MTTRHRTKGISLAKGPIGLMGLALLAYGITALIFGGHGFTQHAPIGAVHGKTWLGLEVNGWSGVLFVAAGLLLLLGAPRHWGAKSMSLAVGISLAALCVIALANGHGALGLFAANGLTELIWGAAGALLIILSLLPRVGRKTRPAYERTTPTGATRHGRVTRHGRITNGAREGSPVAAVSDRDNAGRDTPVVSH
jgi:hypothetical protein